MAGLLVLLIPVQIIAALVHTLVHFLDNLHLLLPDPAYVFDSFRLLSRHMVLQSIPLPREYALMVLEILLELRFKGMLIILEADSEQFALQLVIALVEQIFRGVVRG